MPFAGWKTLIDLRLKFFFSYFAATANKLMPGAYRLPKFPDFFESSDSRQVSGYADWFDSYLPGKNP